MVPSSCAAVAIVVLAMPAAAADFSPYRAVITAPSAAVRSGPGNNFYETDTLAEGDFVDVYREQGSGWCAIRPTEGSFSWVLAEHLSAPDAIAETPAPGPEFDGSLRVARVEQPDTPSRIGSRLTVQKNAVQVRLKPGERVRIFSEEVIDGQTWYKIAPPAGEFRWIHISHLRAVGPVATATPDDERRPVAEEKNTISPILAGEEPISTSADVTTVAATDADILPIGSGSRYPELATIPSAASPQPTAPPLLSQQAQPGASPIEPIAPSVTKEPGAAGDAWRAAAVQDLAPVAGGAAMAANAGQTSAGLPATLAPIAPSSASPAAAAPSAAALANPPPIANNDITPIPPTPTPVAGSAPPARSLTELELRLSRMVAEPPVAWNMEPLRADAQLLLASAPVAEKPELQATIAKIDRFAAIARKYREANGLPAEATVAPDGTRFDAVGVLRPVNSQRPGAPPFALVDDSGQVVSFITPAAGMNLRPLVGQRIGVTGNRGYIPEFQRAHVVAGRALAVGGRNLR